MMRNGWIQVAGIIDQAEADMLVSCGVNSLGFPLRLPVHREDLSEADAADIIHTLPDACPGVVITYLADADEIMELCESLGADWVQLHGQTRADQLRRLRSRAPKLTILQSLVIGRIPFPELCAFAEDCADDVDGFLTDTFDPVTGASGATGRQHDWALSRELSQACNRPLWLAGGLTPDNVAEAIQAVRPAGVDAHTGLEDATGRKDPRLVQRFVEQAQRAFSSLPVD